ncbi:MAG TPA: hypothetical protein VFV33_11905, partial [Gemmatimonadaceae bacterium]|nr:hypothetical protein [Gemmatimonadaceae bacterium]
RALRRTGRPIVFSVCEWGAREPWRWAAASGGHLWRTTWDVRDTWEGEYHAGRAGIMSIVDRQVALADYAGPGRWNDPDMLVVGLYGKGESSTITGYPPMNDTEYRTQMSLWCLMAAPLLISCDVRSMNAPTRETLGHPEIIAIDQDPLGRQGYRAIKDRTIEIWKKPLAGGEVALGFLNRGDAAAEVTLRWTDIALAPSWRVRDVWRREELGVVRDRITLAVASHETRVVRLSR